VRWIRAHIAGVVVTLAVAVAVVVAAVGWFVLAVLPALRGEVDHAADRADAALSKGVQVDARLSIAEGTLDRVDKSVAGIDGTLAGFASTLATTAADAAQIIRSIDQLVDKIPGASAQVANQLREAFAGGVASAEQLIAQGRALYEQIQRGGVPVNVGGTVDHDIHLLGPTLNDLSDALLLTRQRACQTPLIVLCLA
jgi:hypothetical protein